MFFDNLIPMKRLSSGKTSAALTALELLVVLGLLAILVLMILPSLPHHHPRATITGCVNNLKQIGLSAKTWAFDNTNRFPPQVHAKDGGSMELISSGSPSPHFQTMSNELSTPKILCCPAETKREAGTNFDAISDLNISYFFNVDAIPESPNVLLAGDRSMALDGRALKPGLATITRDSPLVWTRDLHYRSAKMLLGNILYADGHVEGRITNLTTIIQKQTLATNRLAIP